MPVVHHVTDLPGAPQIKQAVDRVTSIIAADKAKLDMKGKPSFYFLRNILQALYMHAYVFFFLNIYY